MPMSYCIHRLHILARTDKGVFYMDVLSIRSNFVNLQELDKKKLILNKRRLELVGIEKCLSRRSDRYAISRDVQQKVSFRQNFNASSFKFLMNRKSG